MLLVKNRSASFDYEIIEKFTAGIVLKGYEVKAVKEKKANLAGAYVQLLGGSELYAVNMYIGHYSKQSQKTLESDLRRTRKLLLTNSENEKQIQKDLEREAKEFNRSEGLTDF